VTSIHVHEYEVLAASVDGSVRTFDVRTGELVTDSFGPPSTSVTLSRDAQCTLVGLLDSKVLLLDRSSGELLAQYEGHKNMSFKVDCCLTHDDAYVLSGSEDGKVYFWNLVEADVVKSLLVNPSGAPATALAWHPQGKCLLTSSQGGEINIWKTSL
jgi:mitogen-activated protein kinase organizer 1